MSPQSNDRRPDEKDEPKRATEAPPGTETRKKGGTDAAKRQAERDWQDSAKESGE